MTRRLSTLYRRLRQWTFPEAFRIAVRPSDDWAKGFALAVKAELEDAKKQLESAAKQSKSEPPKESVPGLAPDFVMALCTQYFRIRNGIEMLSSVASETRELRSLRYTLRKMENLFEDNGIECLDLAGQIYDDGRTDFVPLGEATVVAELTQKTIMKCESPAVFLKGKLIQKAHGTIGKPAK
jgi:hypothetical protein